MHKKFFFYFEQSARKEIGQQNQRGESYLKTIVYDEIMAQQLAPETERSKSSCQQTFLLMRLDRLLERHYCR